MQIDFNMPLISFMKWSPACVCRSLVSDVVVRLLVPLRSLAGGIRESVRRRVM